MSEPLYKQTPTIVGIHAVYPDFRGWTDKRKQAWRTLIYQIWDDNGLVYDAKEIEKFVRKVHVTPEWQAAVEDLRWELVKAKSAKFRKNLYGAAAILVALVGIPMLIGMLSTPATVAGVATEAGVEIVAAGGTAASGGIISTITGVITGGPTALLTSIASGLGVPAALVAPLAAGATALISQGKTPKEAAAQVSQIGADTLITASDKEQKQASTTKYLIIGGVVIGITAFGAITYFIIKKKAA